MKIKLIGTFLAMIVVLIGIANTDSMILHTLFLLIGLVFQQVCFKIDGLQSEIEEDI